MGVLTFLKPQRSLAGIVADTVLEEQHEDRLVITDHPVEQGSTISDHAYKLPAQVVLEYVWSGSSIKNLVLDNSFLRTIYQQLLQLQVDRALFQVFTGKRVYSNMILEALHVTTDVRNENILRVRATCREMLLATTQLVTLSNSAVQILPQQTQGATQVGQQNLLPAPNFNFNSFNLIP